MLIIYNAHLHTLNPLNPTATALVIQDGYIQAIGTDDEILQGFSPSTLQDAKGRTIIPGLTDAHIHLEAYALNLQKLDCDTLTQQECLGRVAERISQTPPGEWILGHGWNQNSWSDGYGSAQQLNAIAPRNPVYLTHKSLHSAWVNSAALHLAGITSGTPDPAGGRIGHLPDGDPSGILFESASDLVEKVIPEPGLAHVVDALRLAQPGLLRMGLTGVHDFDSSRCFSALQVLHQAGELKLRVVKSIPLEHLPAAVELGLRTGFGTDRLRIGPVKLFADGALGPHTAAMYQPYADQPQNRGILMMDVEKLLEYGRLAAANGISLAVHAIGDRANYVVLDAYAQLRAFEATFPFPNRPNLRHRIEHVQLLHPDDVARLAQLDIIASMQPIHATSDMPMADRYWGQRSAFAYAWRRLIEHGTLLIFGSDAPVESPNPFWGIYAAVTRQRADGSPGPQGWYPDQRLNVEEVLHDFTTGPAFAAGVEKHSGRLAPGYLADLLVLDTDPFSCPPDELRNIQPLATMIHGEWIFSQLE